MVIRFCEVACLSYLSPDKTSVTVTNMEGEIIHENELDAGIRKTTARFLSTVAPSDVYGITESFDWSGRPKVYIYFQVDKLNRPLSKQDN